MPSVIRGSDNFDSLESKGLGDDQTWQNVTGSRALATAYTNSTGRPIHVSIIGIVTINPGTMNLLVNGDLICQYNINTVNAAGITGMLHAIIPNGSTYQLTAANMTINRWNELR